MVVTQSKAVAGRARRLRDLAFAHATRDYRHSELAFNYRMTNVQAAIGLAQLRRIDEFIEHRRACARIYADLLGDIDGVTLPAEAPWARNVYWMYAVLIPGGVTSRARIIRRLASEGIESRVAFWPLHRQAIRGGHFHRRKHEFVLVLQGTLECVLCRARGGVLQRLRLGPRSGLLHVPPGVGHQFRNIGSAPAQALVLSTMRYDVARPDKVPAKPSVSGLIGRLSNPRQGGSRN